MKILGILATGLSLLLPAAAAAQKAAVRDNVAGFYYHPFLGTGPLRRLINGLRNEGYRFVSACAVVRG